MDEKQAPKPFNGLHGLSEEEVLEIIGDPREIARASELFRKSIDALLSQESKLMKRYPQEWVAFYDGRLRAHDKSLDAVLEMLDAKGLPRGETLVEFLETEPRNLIV